MNLELIERIYIKLLFEDKPILHILKMNWITNDDTIIFGPEFNKKLDIELISGFTKLIFSNHELNEKLFEHYTNNDFMGLEIKKNRFNKDVSFLPYSLTHLTFGHCFNRDVYVLHQGITHLTFGEWFDKDVSVLPLTLTHLTFGYYFNQDVSKLPHSLILIKFGHVFNQSVSKLPPSLTYLTFGYSFNQDISNLPLTLTYLTFGYSFNQDVSNLPPTLTYLTFGDKFNQNVSKLPQNLTNLSFGYYFNQDISKLPPFITHLKLGYKFDKEYKISLNIKYLELNCNNQCIIDSLPNSIVELKLGYSFNLQMDNLPTSIKKLVFYKNCKCDLTYSYLCAEELLLNGNGGYSMDLNCLPDFIEELQLNKTYTKRILKIPLNLKKLICHKDYAYKDDFVMCKVETYT